MLDLQTKAKPNLISDLKKLGWLGVFFLQSFFPYQRKLSLPFRVRRLISRRARALKHLKSHRQSSINPIWHGNYKKESLLHGDEQIGFCFRLLRNPAWRPITTVNWGKQLDEKAALTGGAVLWFADFAYSDLIAKLALAEIGLKAFHVGSSTHGVNIAPSRMKRVSRIKMLSEDLFLKKRLLIDPENPAKVLFDSRKALQDGETVLFRIGPYLGKQKAGGKLFGSHYETSLGAPYLAHITGRPLLVGFTLRKPDGSFDLMIKGPIAEGARSLGKTAFLNLAVEEMLKLHEAIVPLYPDQWRGWHCLKKGEVVIPFAPKMRKSGP